MMRTKGIVLTKMTLTKTTVAMRISSYDLRVHRTRQQKAFRIRMMVWNNPGRVRVSPLRHYQRRKQPGSRQGPRLLRK